MAWIPDNTTLNQLKCCACKSYLSVGPVTQTPVGYDCGRCLDTGSEPITIFEVLAKNCLFPCRFDGNGCTAKLAFGEGVINHEKFCQYRLISCPAADDCEWSGSAITTIEHCSNEHIASFVEGFSFEFEIKLQDSVNNKTVFKIKSGEVFLIHLMYSEAMGLSINVNLLIMLNKEQDFCYTVRLRSSDGSNMTQLTNKQIDATCSKSTVEWLPSNVLYCLDKRMILVTIEVKKDKIDEDESPKCDNCYQTLPLYLLKCLKNHRFCRNCRTTDQKCFACETPLRIVSNYHAMATQEGIFACCNAFLGCRFFDNLTKLQEHEKTCILQNCVIEDCSWKGCEQDFWIHLTNRQHAATTSKIVIEEKDIKNQSYLMWISASCNEPYNAFTRVSSHSFSTLTTHTHCKGLFIIQIPTDDVKNIVKVVANYIAQSPNTTFTSGVLKITLGQTFTYKSIVGIMNAFNIDRSCEINICRSLLKQQKAMTVELVNCTLLCK